MHDLSLTLFYKTSIDIESTREDGDVLWSLVCDIRRWMTRKWDSRGVEIPRDDTIWSMFKSGSRFVDPSGTVQFVSSICYAENDKHKWACSITENFTEKGYAVRKWVTEIGLSCESQISGTVSLVLSYSDQPGFLGPCQEEPGPSIPGIVGNLLSDKWLKCKVSGIDLQREARELKVGTFPQFWTLISDSRRDTPVIFISPRTDEGESELLVDPQVLADTVGPSALVYYTKDKDFIEEMLATIPDYAYRCSNGTVRAYAPYPHVDDQSDQYRHRYFTSTAIEEMGADALVSMFRRAYAQDVQFYERMVRTDVVRDMVYRSTLTKRADRRVEEAEETALDMAGDIEKQLSQKANEVDALKDENNQLKSDIHGLELKVSSYEAAFRYGSPDSEKPREVWPWPQTSREVVEAFRKTSDDKIVFTQRSMDSLDDCRSSAETLWNALYDLRAIAYDLYTADDSMDIAKEFNTRSKFKYARNAGMMTRKNGSLMQQYFDEYDGRQINVETHIKSGSKEADPKFIRIYFAYDEQTERIVVSYIGAHLDNYSTQFIH